MNHKARKKIPEAKVIELLYKNRHTCCVCNVWGKSVQTHHIDGHPENYDDDNLIVTCIDCHDKIEKEGKLGRKFRKSELLKYRHDWEEKIRQNYHPMPIFDEQKMLSGFETILQKHLNKYERTIEENKTINATGRKTLSGNNQTKNLKSNASKMLEFLFESADSFFEKKLFHEAAKFYQQIHILYPELWSARGNYALCLLRNGKAKKALNIFLHHHQKHPTNQNTIYNIASCYLNFHNFKKAKIYSDKLLRLNPKDEDAIIQRGLILERESKLKEATDYYLKAIKLRRKNPHAYYHMVEANYKMGNHTDALKYCRLISKITHKDPSNFFRMGTLLCETGKHKDALSYFSRALKIEPKNPQTLFSKGLELTHLERKKDAIKILRKAKNLDPENTAILGLLGATLDESGETKKALRIFELSLHLQPKNYKTLYSLGLVNDNLGNHKEAIKFYKKSLKINPRFVDALINLGYVILRYQNNPQKSLALFKKALVIEPTHIIGLVDETLAWIALENIKQAEYNILKISKINPTTSYISYLKGVMELKKNDERKAFKFLKKAMELDPDFKSHFKTDPFVENIRENSEFSKLINDS